MDIYPSELTTEFKEKLTRNEKLFMRYANSSNAYGVLMLRVNPSMIDKEYLNVLITSEGVLFIKFFDEVTADSFSSTVPIYYSYVHKKIENIVFDRLKNNKALVDSRGYLKFKSKIVYIFPKLDLNEIDISVLDSECKAFIENNCLFKSDFNDFRSNFETKINLIFDFYNFEVPEEIIVINENNINSIIQRIAPEYVTIRVAEIVDNETFAGADKELLVVDENDVAVKAFRLDKDQINIVNKINSEQLILACAGSGKSVLLISKCFKAAQMNPNKKFLITCYNSKLKDLYLWYIDRAGLQAKNVECVTFHYLCKSLLNEINYPTQHKDFDGWVKSAIAKVNDGSIKKRYYGIFIDEVQIFDNEWYKFCYNLLENKNSKDHIFVICGDKTQNLKNQQRHGQAPWQAGENYPNYRGGNRNIRIEKNYRNCIEVNEFINRFVSEAKKYIKSISETYNFDSDEFLRGQSFTNGFGAELTHLSEKTNQAEADLVVNKIVEIHDKKGIPYDEIAIIMHNSKYSGFIKGWRGKYDLEYPLTAYLNTKGIPYAKMYNDDSGFVEHFGDADGVKLIKFDSTLGLDFRAAIVCGLIPFGYYDNVKIPNTALKSEDELDVLIDTILSYIRKLYVACTRAKEFLSIIAPESGKESVFIKMLEDAV